jgi:hypothetical protein
MYMCTLLAPNPFCAESYSKSMLEPGGSGRILPGHIAMWIRTGKAVQDFVILKVCLLTLAAYPECTGIDPGYFSGVICRTWRPCCPPPHV